LHAIGRKHGKLSGANPSAFFYITLSSHPQCPRSSEKSLLSVSHPSNGEGSFFRMTKKSRNKGGKSSRADEASSNAGGSSSRETMLDALVFESSATDRTKRLGIRRISTRGVGRRPADELAGRRVVEVPDLGSVVGGVWSGSGSHEACCGERPGKLTPPLFPPYQTCTIATTKSRS
jgi:hypothetical protein